MSHWMLVPQLPVIFQNTILRPNTYPPVRWWFNFPASYHLQPPRPTDSRDSSESATQSQLIGSVLKSTICACAERDVGQRRAANSWPTTPGAYITSALWTAADRNNRKATALALWRSYLRHRTVSVVRIASGSLKRLSTFCPRRDITRKRTGIRFYGT